MFKLLKAVQFSVEIEVMPFHMCFSVLGVVDGSDIFFC
jgi:hypothetical protein